MLSQKLFNYLIQTTVRHEWKRKRVSYIRNNFKYKTLLAKEPYEAPSHLERIVSADLLENRRAKEIPLVRKQRKRAIGYKGELLYGIHPVRLALIQQKRQFHHLFVKCLSPNTSNYENAALKDEIKELGFSLGILTTYLTNQQLKCLAPDALHQGICLDVSAYPLVEYGNTEEMKPDVSCSNFPIWLVLDAIQDPMNMGAILRSAYYFGVDRLFITAENSCKLSPTVSKASSGALEILDIYKVSDLCSFLKDKKLDGWDIVSTEVYKPSEENQKFQGSSLSLSDYTVVKPTIVILGNECKGISPAAMSLCDHIVSIYPPKKLHVGLDCLNVSVATGILLHHLLPAKKPAVS